MSVTTMQEVGSLGEGTMMAYKRMFDYFVSIIEKRYNITVRYHCGGWSEEVNSSILVISYMVYL